MDPRPENSPIPRDDAETAPVQRPDRRALLRAGAGSVPVVLSLASRPVRAGTCTVASSFVSVATFQSRNANSSAQCATRSCESWRTECNTSGATYKSYMDSTKVDGLLGTCSPTSTYSTWSLSKVMKTGTSIDTTTELGVLQHLISLCMNVKSGNATTPGDVSQLYLGNVWKNYKSNGNRYVLSSSGINWDSSQLITWIRMLIYTNP